MLRKISFILIAALLSTCLTLGMGSAEVYADEIKFEFTMAPLSNMADFETSFKYFNDALKERSGGKLELVEKAKKKDVFRKVQDGGLDVGYGLPSQTGASEGVIYLGIPFGFNPADHVTWLLEGGGLELQREIYAAHNVVPVPIAVMPESGGWFLEEIPETADDFNNTGWLLRWFGLGKTVLQEAFPGLNFITESAGSVALGTFGTNAGPDENMLNAFEFSSPNNDWRLLFDLMPNPPETLNPVAAGGEYYYKTWHQPVMVGELWFNKDFWENDLKQSDRDLIKEIAIDTLLDALQIDQQDSIGKMVYEGLDPEKVGIDWPTPVLDALKREAVEIYDGYRDDDPDGCGRVLESMIEFGWDLYSEE